MANLENIRSAAVRAANTTIKKTGEIATTASMHVKLIELGAKRDNMFEKLGRLTYKQLKSGESHAEEIAALVEGIDKLGVLMAQQRAKIAQAKAEKVQAKQQKKQADRTHTDEDITEGVKDIIEENK